MSDLAIYCENCGSEDIRWMTSDLDEIDGYMCYIDNSGVCGKCGKKNKWTEVYVLTRVYDRRIVED